jgi:hypothetical protein
MNDVSSLRGRVTEDAAGRLTAPDTPAAPESPRLRFRRFLADRIGGVAEAAWYFEQATPRFVADPEARLVVEELIDHLARLMLFEVEREDEAGLSVWSSASGPQLVVAAMDTTEAIVSLGRLSRSRDELRAGGRLRPELPASTLGVICGEGRYRMLEHAVGLRRVSDPIRLVSLEALLTLARTVEAGALPHAVAVMLLQPPAAFADPLITGLAGPHLRHGSPETA